MVSCCLFFSRAVVGVAGPVVRALSSPQRRKKGDDTEVQVLITNEDLIEYPQAETAKYAIEWTLNGRPSEVSNRYLDSGSIIYFFLFLLGCFSI
jgi:hypothetical protein